VEVCAQRTSEALFLTCICYFLGLSRMTQWWPTLSLEGRDIERARTQSLARSKADVCMKLVGLVTIGT